MAELDDVGRRLTELGVDTQEVPLMQILTGYQLGAFVTGALHLGAVIGSNVYHPGSIVDNLTSFGAVPSNFDSDGNVQVSVSRWVAQGVAGIHGTTAEPISNAFPHRRFLVDYVKGFTLAESFARNLRAIYWRNLILGIRYSLLMP